MKRLLFLTPLLLLTALTTFAQQATLKGKIIDSKTGAAVPMATVVIDGSTLGTTTDFSGNYELSVEPGEYTIKISYLGYEEQSVTMVLHAGTVKVLNVQLEDKIEELGVVTISGGKYEKDIGEEIVSMEVIKLTTIESSNSTAQEAMNKIPGVQMVGENVSIRGGSGYASGVSSRVMLLLDDVPLMGPANAEINWESLPLDNVEQIEVVKGASSALYGSSALNGLIHVRTKNPKAEPYHKVVTAVGMYDDPKEDRYTDWWKEDGHTPMFGSVSYTYMQRLKPLDITFSGKTSFDNSYLQDNNQHLSRGYIKLRHISPKVEGLTVGMNAGGLYNYGKTFFLWKDTGDAILTPLDSTSFKEWTLNLDPYVTYFDKKENKHTLRLRYYHTYYNNFGPEFSTNDQFYGEYSFYRLMKNLNLNLNTGISGSTTTTSSITYGNHTGSNVSAYVQADKKFFDKLTLSVGLRLEYFKVDSIKTEKELEFISLLAGKKDNPITSPVVPVIRFGLNYQATKGTYIRASFGQGYRFPTITELFVRTQRSGVQVYPNPDLLPESGWSAELGVKQAFKVSDWVGYLDISGFWTEFNNMMEFQFGTYGPPQPPTFGIGFRTNNVENARILGYEISTLGEGKIFDVPLTFIAGYTRLYPYNLDSLDAGVKQILKYRIEHTFKADIELEADNFTVGVSGQYRSFVKAIDPALAIGVGGINAYRKENSKGDFVFDLRFGYRIKGGPKVSLIAKNIFNEEYTLRPGLLEPPRNVTLQMVYEL